MSIGTSNVRSKSDNRNITGGTRTRTRAREGLVVYANDTDICCLGILCVNGWKAHKRCNGCGGKEEGNGEAELDESSSHVGHRRSREVDYHLFLFFV
jgi:hypothetical protein